MPPPLIDRIQQNLQPVVTTTTWANVPAPILVVIQTGGDFGIPQPITPPADVTFSFISVGAPFTGTAPVNPESGGRELTYASTLAGVAAITMPGVPGIPPTLVEVGRAFVSPVPEGNQAPPGVPVDVPISPADVPTGEANPGFGSNPTPGLPDIPVSPADFVFVVSTSPETPSSFTPLHVLVVPPLTVTFTVNAAQSLSFNSNSDVPNPLVEAGTAPVLASLLNAVGPVVSAVVAAAIALTPSSQVNAAFSNVPETRVEEPYQPPLPPIPIDWLWDVNIKWEAEPPPSEVSIEEPLRPEPPWVESAPPGPWQIQTVIAVSSWVPPPQPEPPPPPPPPSPGGGGGPNPNPFASGGGDWCPPDPCDPVEEEQRRRFFQMFGDVTIPRQPSPVVSSSGVPEGTDATVARAFIEWLKDAENRRKVKKAVKWGLSAWAVYKRLKGDD